jgi:hypothetical protein
MTNIIQNVLNLAVEGNVNEALALLHKMLKNDEADAVMPRTAARPHSYSRQDKQSAGCASEAAERAGAPEHQQEWDELTWC